MKKYFILLFVIMCLPFMVHAESKYLYDVLKDETENGGLAREYTGEHHDSFTEEPTHKIYHWYAENDDEGNQVLEKNNVIFGGFCWQIIRTTDTGGVKMIYNGSPNNIYEMNDLSKNQYNILTNTLNFNWNSSNNEWISEVDDITTKEFSFKIIDSNYYDLVLTVESESGSEWGLSAFNNGTEIIRTGSPVIVNNLIHSFGYITNENVIKINFNHYRNPYSPSKIKIKMVQRGSLLGVGCDNYGIDSQFTERSSFNNSYSSPAYVGYMYNKETLIESSGKEDPQENSLFGNNITYQNGIYTLNDTQLTYDSNHHYTCNTSSNSCSTIRYYYLDNYFIEISDGRNIEKVLNDMLYSDNVNVNDSTIKSKIDTWYESNLEHYNKFLEDVIFCNDRSVLSLGGWNPNGGNISDSLKFINNSYSNSDLSCNNITDQFSLYNNKAKLKYPIGLMSAPEMILINNSIPRKTGKWYWLISPYSFYSGYSFANNRGIAINGATPVNSKVNDSTNGIRPSISLKKNTRYRSGNGSKITPYIINEVDYYSINVNIVKETKDLNIVLDDISQVEYEEEVTFTVKPIKGFKVNSIKIVDEDNNEIDYQETDNKNEYTFVMPASDVTIIPSYERVKNSVNVDNNKNTKEIIIEVNDVSAVVYEDKVKFTVTPEEGYEVDTILITDSDGNKVEYKKTNKENEYEFIMPDTDVVITPTYRKIESINVPDTLKNPNTGTGISIIIIVMLIISSITYIIFKRKKNYIMK